MQIRLHILAINVNVKWKEILDRLSKYVTEKVYGLIWLRFEKKLLKIAIFGLSFLNLEPHGHPAK
jgi:hypothetical protein